MPSFTEKGRGLPNVSLRGCLEILGILTISEQLCRQRIARDLEEEEERCGNEDAVVIHARNNPDDEVTR